MALIGYSEFTELGHLLGIRVGRLYRPDIAHAGDYVFAITDEEQEEVYAKTVAPKSYVQITQNVDVTLLAGIDFWLKWKAPTVFAWKLQISIGGVDIWEETMSPGDPERDWYRVTASCAKVVGMKVVAIIVSPA